MAYLVIPLFIALLAGYAYLKSASARARELAGMPPRARTKLPLSWWILGIFLLFINAAILFSQHLHRAP